LRVLIIKQLFYPEPTARSLDFAKELVRQGCEVEVLTGFPSYPQGAIYEGFRQRVFHRETIEGINVIRVPIYPYHGSSGIRRILNYMSFAISATIFGLPRVKKHDVVFAYQGALPVGVPAMINKVFRRVPFVYDINDLCPDTLLASGLMINKVLLKIVSSWCKVTYGYADHISVLSNGFKKELIKRGVEKEKISVVFHWSRDVNSQISNNKPSSLNLFSNNDITILYAGNHGILQSLESILEAASRISRKYDNVKFVFLGDGADKTNLMDYAKTNKIENVKFLDGVNPWEVYSFLSAADILLVHLKKNKLFEITIPSKTISYLNAGKPILIGMSGDAAQLVEDAKAGYACIPDDVEDITKKLQQIIDLTPDQRVEMGRSGKEYYLNNLSISTGTKKYIDYFNRITI